MRVFRFATLLLASLLVTSWCEAQQPTTTAPSARALLQRSLAALTGGVAIDDVAISATARRITGSGDETGTVVLKALATGEASADFSYPSGSQREVRANSTEGPTGSWSNPDGTSGAIAFHNLLVDSAWFSPALMLGKLNSSGDFSIVDAGTETRGGSTVEHLTVSRQFPGLPTRISVLMQRLSQLEVYLDTSSALPVSISFNTHPANNAGRDIPVAVTLSDYRLVNGVQIPFHIQRTSPGDVTLDLQIQKADLNVGLRPSLFVVPSPVPVSVR